MKNFKKIFECYQRIQVVEDEIKKINQLASMLATEKCSGSIKISITNPNKKEDILDEDGSLINWNKVDRRGFYWFSSDVSKKKDSEEKDSVKLSLEDTQMIEFLGIIIKYKQEERKYFIKEAEKLLI